MKEKHLTAHMKVAHTYAGLSYCNRKQVGCVIVKDDRIVSIGYNGTPAGWDNCCETADNKTHNYVYHAEENAILKLAGSHESGHGATFFITCAPCIKCAKMIATLEPEAVYYGEEYKNMDGVEHLRLRKIKTIIMKDTGE